MSQKLKAAITSVGGYVPETKLTNFDLEKMVDTNDEWIKSRTGISERRILREPGKASSDMAARAIEEILRKKQLDPLEIDCIICATVTPDMVFPATANIIGDKIGAKNAFGFDLGAACSGFLFALTTGASFVEAGRYKKVIVVGVDKMSSIIDYTDRATCIIFGDGAGAVMIDGVAYEGAGITSKAFAQYIPYSNVFLTVAVVLFAVSTMISWSYYGLQSWKFLFGRGKTADIVYKLLFCLFVVIGAAASMKSIWDFSDAMIFAMVFPNMVGLFFLFPVVKKELNRYLKAIRTIEG